MYERGELLDISRWVSPEECDLIQGALSLFEEPYQMKAIHEHFGERFNLIRSVLRLRILSEKS
ncbi:MAG: hypothetical protein IPH31_13080 [Lewinellaceae bacterium]|nr:hypothetical protein [Lewinellaceae bacterium]